MSKLAETFRKNAKARLKELGLKQNELAQKLNQRDTLVSKYLRGDIPNPGIEIIEQFSIALEMTASDLLKATGAHVAPRPPTQQEILAAMVEGAGLSKEKRKLLSIIIEGDDKAAARFLRIIEISKQKALPMGKAEES